MTSAPEQETQESFRDRLVAFYASYNPSCVNSVDAIMATYRGREEDLMKVLVAKYGPEQPVLNTGANQQSGRSSKTPAFTAYETALEVLANEPQHRTSSSPVTKQMLVSESRLQHRHEYGALPAASWKSRFFNFYSYYNPEKLPDVDKKLQLHAGSEAEWMARLVAKYGPEPPPRKSRSVSVNSDPQQQVLPHSDHQPTNHRAVHTSYHSPSPPSHVSVYQPILSQRFEHPSQGSLPPQNSDDISDVIARLTHALDTKSRELVAIKGEKRVLDERLQTAKNQISGLENELIARQQNLDTLQDELRSVSASYNEAVLKLKECDSKLAEQHRSFQSQLADAERAGRAMATREHQNRLLRTQLEQSAAEVALREKQNTELSHALRHMHQINKDLVDENSALRLSLTEPSSEQRFCKVVEEIQHAAQLAFENRRKVLETEMQHYYEYAKQQVSQRDATIQLLMDQLAVAGECAPPKASLGEAQPASSATEKSLAQEVARLKLQLSVQNEELKVLLAQRSRAEAVSLTPPLLTNEARLGEEIDRLKSELKKTQDEAQAAREALQTELGRQVEEMRDIHQRVDAYEHEKGHLLKVIDELKGIQGQVDAQKSNPVAYDQPSYTKSNVWSLLYER